MIMVNKCFDVKNIQYCTKRGNEIFTLKISISASQDNGQEILTEMTSHRISRLTIIRVTNFRLWPEKDSKIQHHLISIQKYRWLPADSCEAKFSRIAESNESSKRIVAIKRPVSIDPGR